MMIIAVTASVLTLAIVAFVVGYLFGKDVGKEVGRQSSADLCLEYARAALHGHPAWRSLTPAGALRLVASRIRPQEAK